MVKNFRYKIKKNLEIFLLILLILLSISSTSYFNYKKNLDKENYHSFIDNVYLIKTLSYIIDNLEPKYKKVKHTISTGETFDEILKDYSIKATEINKIKKSLKKKVNLNNV